MSVYSKAAAAAEFEELLMEDAPTPAAQDALSLLQAAVARAEHRREGQIDVSVVMQAIKAMRFTPAPVGQGGCDRPYELRRPKKGGAALDK